MEIFFRKYGAILCVGFSVALFFIFGLQHLTQFETADEAYWIQERIPQYWKAVGEQKWKKTLINDKPGVSVALVSGVALLFQKDPHYYQPISGESNGAPIQIGPDKARSIFFAFRFPILVVNTLLLVYFYWALQKITRRKSVAVMTIVGIGFSPMLIGISQVVNPDALLWSFGFATVLSFFLMLREKEKYFIGLTALFFAFSLLSKYTAIIFLPLFLVILIGRAFSDESAKDDGLDKRTQILAQSARRTLMMIVATVGGVFILLPAFIIEPQKSVLWITSFSDSAGILLVVSVLGIVVLSLMRPLWMRFLEQLSFLWRPVLFLTFLFPLIFMVFLLFARPLNDPEIFSHASIGIKYADDIGIWDTFTPAKKTANSLLLQYNQIVFSLPPITLFFLIAFWVGNIFGYKQHKKFLFLGFSFTVLFIVLPIGYRSENILAVSRYFILLYPFAAVLAAFSFVSLTDGISERFSWKRGLYYGVCCVFGGALFFSTALSIPFYFTYTNIFLPKEKIIHDTWGYGGYEAAQYVHAQENGSSAVVWADYDGVCPFIQGTCITNYHFDKERFPVDYYVLTRRGRARFKPEKHAVTPEPDLVDAYLYYDAKPVWQMFIHNRAENYIRIVRGK